MAILDLPGATAAGVAFSPVNGNTYLQKAGTTVNSTGDVAIRHAADTPDQINLILGGTVTGELGGVYLFGGSGTDIGVTVLETGLVATRTNATIRLSGDGNHVVNHGTVLSFGVNGTGIDLGGANGLVENHGTIQSTYHNGAGANGVALFGGGTNTVRNFGEISARSPDSAAVASAAPITLVENHGSLMGRDRAVWDDNAAGVMTLVNTGSIGGRVDLRGGADVVSNSGTISGAVQMGGGADVVSNSGTIAGAVDMGTGSARLTNSGTITGLVSGEVVIAENRGAMEGGLDVSGISTTVTNTATGSIIGDGFAMLVNGIFDNAVLNEGVVTGGLYVDGLSATVANTGRIIATFVEGIYAPGTNPIITNTGQIVSALTGVSVPNGGGRLVNAGTIVSSSGDAVSGLRSVFNTGVLSGATYGVLGNDQINNLRNGGEINGTVSLGLGADRLVNRGVISDSSGTAVDMGGGTDADVVVNRGVIDGNVVFGDGPNLYRGRGTGAVEGTVIGLAGNDTLRGTAEDNSFDGGDDADLLKGRAGEDTLSGGTGSDTLLGGAEDDSLDGGDDADLLKGWKGEDTLSGGTGADTLLGGAGDDSLLGGGGDDTLEGGAGADTLDGGADVDTASYAGSAAGVTVRLWNGTGTGGDAEGDSLIGIENVTGSRRNDELTGADAVANALSGGAGNDTLAGLSGNDTLEGGPGADMLDGGADTDTASYAGSAGGVTVRLWNGTGIGGDAQGDTLAGIENVTGSGQADVLLGAESVANLLSGGGGNDYLAGLSGNDRLEGGPGNDLLEGGAGADVLDGGADIDTASYAGSAAGVTVRLWNGTGIGGDAQGDTLTGIENVTGSAQADALLGADGVGNLLSGGGGIDYLAGLSGNDTLVGGAGADALDGGADIDTASYAGSATGVTVRLWNGTGTGGDAQGDTLTGIENVTGSAQADALLGAESVGNLLSGGGGNDYLAGLSGNDTLDGGVGNDILDGGTGSDVFVFGAGYGQDTVTAFENGIDVVDLVGGLAFADLSLSPIAGGVRAAITATPAHWIDLLGVVLGDITAADFI